MLQKDARSRKTASNRLDSSDNVSSIGAEGILIEKFSNSMYQMHVYNAQPMKGYTSFVRMNSDSPTEKNLEIKAFPEGSIFVFLSKSQILAKQW